MLTTVEKTKPVRFSTDYSSLPLTFLSTVDFEHAENKSKVLSFPELLDYLCINESEVPPIELDWLLRAHTRGRMLAIANAADNLFSSMKARNGHQASLAYLQQLSGTFHLDVTPVKSGSGFNFNVVLKEE